MESDERTLPSRHKVRSEPVFSVSTAALSATPRTITSEVSLNKPNAIDWYRTPSFLRRGIASVRSSQGRESETPDDLRGPLGLHLVVTSPEPLIDIIFVHGLRGGSIKTWRKGDDPRQFWPKHWLPQEPEFQHVNIHSFGYESDWGSTTPSILNVHDFGRELYEEMRSSPTLRRSATSPIIMIGHSMGGLVIKKAFNVAHADTVHHNLSQRIRCMIFLATPHRGSDYAAVLNRIIRVSEITRLSSTREYVKDLIAGSKSTQLINDEFGKFAQELLIHSYYETLETKLPVSSALIVDKNSAILGKDSPLLVASLYLDHRHYLGFSHRLAYPNMRRMADSTKRWRIGAGFNKERVHYMNADHRDMCKFQSAQDSNYVSLKNTIGSAVQDLIHYTSVTGQEDTKSQLRTVQALLQPVTLPEEHHDQLEGSCRWIEEREDFTEWKHSHLANEQGRQDLRPATFWVNANPGAGKTILAAHVATRLERSGLQCATHFFHFGKSASHSLAACLRSIAYQMATSNTAVRDALEMLHDNGCVLDLEDARSVWVRIFEACILQVAMSTPYFWVIDGIDECVNYAEFFVLLKGTLPRFPLRLFLTSRKLPDMRKVSRGLEGFVTTVFDIPASDTMHDVDLFIRSRLELLPLDREEDKIELGRRILAKSNESFLWVRLVMDKLESVYGYDSISEIIEGIPEGMIPYYRRTMLEMSGNKMEKHIAQAMLIWVVSAPRPLTVLELSHAIELDIGVRLPSVKTAIKGLCGDLVCVDEPGGIARIIHNSAREFLLTDDAGYFQINISQAHDRIALVCLRLLVGPELQPPRTRRMIGRKRRPRSPSAMLDYAITQFPEHVYCASSESDGVLVALNTFLTSTVLSWVENIAARKELDLLPRTAQSLKAYLHRRLGSRSPPNPLAKAIDDWATDLSRLVAKFGTALTLSPQSIYFLIPPLCPTDTSIYKQFGRVKDGLLLEGWKSEKWDDCIATVLFENETVAAVASGSNLIAVAFESGNIHVFNHRTFQKELVIQQEFSIDLVYFDPKGAFIAGCSRRFVTLWNHAGKILWTTPITTQCILLASSSNHLLGVTGHGYVFKWDLSTGELLEEQAFQYQPPISPQEPSSAPNKAPFAASISPDLELLALAYRNSPVCLFELNSGNFIGWAIDECSRAPMQLLFNPNPDVDLLLAAYDESHLALYDPWSGELIHSQEPENYAIFNSVSCSPDGRTFAAVDIRGNLRIWDFESLTILYHVLTPDHSFRLLNFTSNGLSLVDAIDNEMRVWSPSVLVGKNYEEEASTSDQAAVPPVTEAQFKTFRESRITAVAAHTTLPIVFVGNQSGEVLAYSSEDGQQLGVMYTHRAEILDIILTHEDMIASSDANRIIQVWQLCTLRGVVGPQQQVFQQYLRAPIRQMLFDDRGEYFLISTAQADYIHSARDGTGLIAISFARDERTIWRWTALPSSANPERFALLADQRLTTYSIEGIATQTPTRECYLQYSAEEDYVLEGISSLVFEPEKRTFVVGIQQRRGYSSNSFIQMFHCEDVEYDEPLLPIQSIRSSICRHFLGVRKSNGRALFLHQNNWISSTEIDSNSQQYTQHFIVTNDFAAGSTELPPFQTAHEGFVFCMHDKVVIVKNGLTFEESSRL